MDVDAVGYTPDPLDVAMAPTVEPSPSVPFHRPSIHIGPPSVSVHSRHEPKRPSINLEAKNLNMSLSYEVSSDGTFKKQGYAINQSGLVSPPLPTSQQPHPQHHPTYTASPRKSFISLSAADLIPLGTLGRGASGSVRKCLHLPSLSLVALKSINIYDKARRDQLIHELHAFESTDSPYLTGFLGAFFDQGCTRLALEFANRGSLQDVVDTFGALPEPCLASIAKQCLLGLQHLHSRRQVHRDIKPANLLVDMHGHVKITDFGLHTELEATDDKCKTFVGTHIYMSPERLLAQQYDYASDVWSLGMSLVTFALGKFPFQVDKGIFGLVSVIAKSPPPTLPRVFSARCRSFVASCLVKDPTLRASVADLLRHPFVVRVDPTAHVEWPFPQGGGEAELADLDVILAAMLRASHAHHAQAGNDHTERIQTSLAERARLGRIAAVLGLPLEVVARRVDELMAMQRARKAGNT